MTAFRTVSLLLLLTGLGACAEKIPRITDVEPELIKLRQGGTLQLQIENSSADTQLSVLPGGPYIRTQTPLLQKSHGLAVIGDMIWLIQDEQTGVGYQPQADGGYRARAQFSTGKPLIALKAQGSRLYATDQDQLISVAAEDPNNLKMLGVLPLPKRPVDFDVGEQYTCLLLQDQLLLAERDEQGVVSAIIDQRPLETPASQTYQVGSHCLTLDERQGIRSFAIDDRRLLANDGYRSNAGSYRLSGNKSPLALADGRTGLTLLGHDSDGRLNWLGSYNKLGRVSHVARDNQRVLTADQAGILSLFDISQPDTPLLLSDFRLAETILALHYADGMATVLTPGKLLQVDFSAESSPSISSLGVNLGGSRRSFLADDILYVADWFSGLHLYDVSSPHAPRLLSSFHTPGSPKGVVVRDHIAYLADDDHGLHIIDVGNPRQPRLLSSLPLSGLAYTMKLRDNTLYLASHRGGFHIIDVADAENPKLLGGYDTPGKSWALDLSDRHVFVADDNSGILIFDVEDPASPRLIGRYNPGGHAEDIVIRDQIAYVAFFDQGLHILDIRDPVKPKAIARLNTPGNARGLKLINDRLYLAAWEAGIQIIDISRLEQPKIIGHYDTRGASWGLSVARPYLYAMDWWGGVRALDIRDERRPIEIGQYQDAGRVEQLAIQGHFAYAASGSRGLQVFDISNALNPVWATGVDFDGEARDVAIHGQHAYVAAGDGGLVVVDISNPFQARWRVQTPSERPADKIRIQGRHAFVSSRSGPLTVYDLSDPQQPLVVASYPARINDLWLTEGRLFLATKVGIEVLSVNNSSQLRLLTHFPTPHEPSLIRVDKDQIYTLEGSQELHRYDWRNGQIRETGQLPLDQAVTDLKIRDGRLYLSAPDYGLLLIDSNAAELSITAEYPTTHRVNAVAFSEQALFFSGETRIASSLQLPEFRQRQRGDQFELDVPASLPMGAYHLRLRNAEGQQQLLHNAFKVGFPKRVKPRFTLEDLKKKLQQKQFEGKAPTHNAPLPPNH